MGLGGGNGNRISHYHVVVIIGLRRLAIIRVILLVVLHRMSGRSSFDPTQSFAVQVDERFI